MNPRVSQEFTGHDARVLRAIESDTGKWFHFEGSEGLPLEHFAVLMEADREQVLERALPFREGEEVYLEIIEPHMYSAGDAVAKVDGYIISVKGAEGAVGQKRLVRIEQVGQDRGDRGADRPAARQDRRAGAGAGAASPRGPRRGDGERPRSPKRTRSRLPPTLSMSRAPRRSAPPARTGRGRRSGTRSRARRGRDARARKPAREG